MMENRIAQLEEKIRALRGFEAVLRSLKSSADWCGTIMRDDEGKQVTDENGDLVFIPPEMGDYNYCEYLAYLKAIEVLSEYVDKM